MSNVKLVVKKIPKFLSSRSPVRIIDGRGKSRKYVMDTIFNNYSDKIIIIGDFPLGNLPVPSSAYTNKLDEALQTVSTHVYSREQTTYDVYKLWWLSDSLPIHYVKTEELMAKIYNAAIDTPLIESVRLTFPIIVIRHNYGLELIDGNHRLKKAVLTGAVYLPVRYINEEMLSACACTGDYF